MRLECPKPRDVKRESFTFKPRAQPV
jgi:hypothetical protein